MARAQKVDIYMPFFVADYLADTTDLTCEEHGAYLLLLLDLWADNPWCWAISFRVIP